MQISVEATQGLEKRMTIEVPAEKIEEEVTKRLQSMRPKVKLHGFRPGKVPLSVVKKQYGDQVRQEVTGEVISSSFYDAVSEKELKPAGMPKIDAHPVTTENGLKFTATFEVYPEFEVTGIEAIALEKPVCEITEADIDNMVEKLQKQQTLWNDVERASQKDDRVSCDFKGTIDGEEFEGGSGTNMPVVLGSNSMIAGFEDALMGKTTGETVEMDLTFPENYHKAELAGKPVHFTVTLVKIEEPSLPEVNEEFVKKFGVEDGDVNTFRSESKDNMQRELDKTLNSKIKSQVMEKLLEANQFDIPQTMIAAEGARIAKQMNDQLQMSGNKLPANMKLFEGKQFEEEGKRRVALGLIISEIIQSNDIKADADKVRAEIDKMAAAYHDPQEVIKWYYQDKNRLSEVESVVLENQVVDWVVERAQVTDKMTSFDEVMNEKSQS